MAQAHVAPIDSLSAAAELSHAEAVHERHFWARTLGAVGVVYGDIGTSPLYAFKEAVAAASGQGVVARSTVLGVLSLMIWALILVVTLKYVLILLRADNKGEGGTFALMSLAQSVVSGGAGRIVMLLGVAGASLFFGDAIITPAISVMSAVEGMKLIAPGLEKFVLPLTVIIMIGLFGVQKSGTEKVASLFGPIMTVWFVIVALGGLVHLADEPGVFAAFNPIYGLKFLFNNSLIGLTALGLVCLAVTGAEALYADLGHFGRTPIQFAWMFLAFPSLLLNYLGQGALVLAHPELIENPFFRMFPGWALVPIVILATMATVIASQAVITGAYSIARQAIQLGFLPRSVIRHTSADFAGQIFLPRVNWLLMVGVLMIVFMFRSSSALAGAYGVAVTGTLVVDSLMTFFVVWKYWKWPLWKAGGVILVFLLIEQAFFFANMIKVAEGGWAPLVIGLSLCIIMLTWVKGSAILATASRKGEADLDWLVKSLAKKPPHKVPGTAVFLTGNPNSAPTALMHNLKHNKVLHERNIILTIKSADTPRVLNAERILIEEIANSFTRVTLTYGFMETPNVPRGLALCRKKGLTIDVNGASFFLSRRSLRPAVRSEMPLWQEKLFLALARTANDATTYFHIPTDRVVEVGTQVAV